MGSSILGISKPETGPAGLLPPTHMPVRQVSANPASGLNTLSSGCHRLQDSLLLTLQCFLWVHSPAPAGHSAPVAWNSERTSRNNSSAG